MKARQAVIVEPYKVEVREVDLPLPAANQVLVAAEVSAVSPGTELAVYTGTHQWLKDPNLPDWKFPIRSGYSAAGRIAAVGANVRGWQAGDRVSYPGNHASHELLTLGHERGRWWKLPDRLDAGLVRAELLHEAVHHVDERAARRHNIPLAQVARPSGHDVHDAA